jgi:DUF971 family protein
MSRPTDIAHSPSANTLTITWSDDTRSIYPVPYLRSWCPCAVCQGHSGRVMHRSAPDSMTITKLWEVGAYALGVRFADGHGDGIYTWEWLRKIAYESPPLGPKLGVFERGVYAAPG